MVSQQTHVFISYSHKDTKHLAKLRTHLAPYLNQDQETIYWADPLIKSGAEWLEEIRQGVARAEVAIFLVSAEFFESPFINKEELTPMLERARKKQVIILPIILRPCEIGQLKNYQATHHLSEPLSKMEGEHQIEQWWSDVAKNIHTTITEHRQKMLEKYSPIPDPQIEQEYRNKLLADAHFTAIKILGMKVPLRLADIYIPVRLLPATRETQLDYVLDPDLTKVRERQNETFQLKIGRKYFESRAANAIDPVEAIRNSNNKHCVILGDPGAGKTTLLKHIALLAARKNLEGFSYLPIYIELNAFVSSKTPDLLEYIARSWQQYYAIPSEQALPFLEDCFLRGDALLLLDGLDETVIGTDQEDAEESYRQVVQIVRKFSDNYGQVPIIVTVRKASYHKYGRLNSFIELEVLAFRPQDISLFIDKWFEHYPNHKRNTSAYHLNTSMKNYPNLLELATSPLLLSLIVIIYEESLRLPDQRSELYEHCVKMLEEWHARNDKLLFQRFDTRKKRPLLYNMAWHFHDQKLLYFSRGDLLTLTEQFLPKIGFPISVSDALFTEVTTEAGLLKEHLPGWYGFLHHAFQEYFAACYATEHQLSTLLEHLGDTWWEEVIMLYAACIPDTSILLQELLARSQTQERAMDLFSYPLIMAGRCLAVSSQVEQVSLRQKVITQLFNELQHTPYTITRFHIAQALTEIGRTNDQINIRLLQLLSAKSTDRKIKRSIIGALGHYANPSIVDELRPLLSQTALDSTFREKIADIIIHLGTPAMVPYILTLLYNKSSDDDTRIYATMILSTIGDSTLAPELLDLLQNHELSEKVREYMVFTVVTLDALAVTPTLIKIVSQPQISTSLANSIAQALSATEQKTILGQLQALLSDLALSPGIRACIACALAGKNDCQVADQLLELLHDKRLEKDIYDRIALSLGKLSDRCALPGLQQLHTDATVDDYFHWAAAIALLMLGDHTVDEELLEMLTQTDVPDHLKRRIVSFLDVSTLLSLLSNTTISPDLRTHIAGTLSTVDGGASTQVVFELSHLLREKLIDGKEGYNRTVRRSIARTLGILVDDEKTIEMLKPLIWEKDIADEMHSALWAMCRRVGVRLFPG